MIGTVQTVTGAVTTFPGRALMHEHIRIGFSGAQLDPRIRLDQRALIESAIEQLIDLRERHDVGLIVDATPKDLCRDTGILREISERSGVLIVASTGMYRKGLGYPPYWQIQDIADLIEFFTIELDEGTEAHGVRCGIIKIATTGAVPLPEEENALRAAAVAAANAGCKILTHTDPDGWTSGNPGLRQAEILIDQGLDPSHVMIGHACGAQRIDQLLDIAHLGAYVAFDRVGMTNVHPDEVRAHYIRMLLDSGYGDLLLLAHDHQHHWVRLRPHPGAPHLDRDFGTLFTDFYPLVRDQGVSPSQFEAIVSANPRRFLFDTA